MNKRVGIYCRVSTLDQNTELQTWELSEYAAARGWTIYKFYDDKATGTNKNRPMLKELMCDAAARKFDLVLCWKLDRFARSLKDLIGMLQELAELGVDFVSLKDQIDLTTAAGRLMVHIIGAFGEFEASLIRERTVAGLLHARAQGKRLGRPRLGKEEKIRSLRSLGFSYRQIEKEAGVSRGSVHRALQIVTG